MMIHPPKRSGPSSLLLLLLLFLLLLVKAINGFGPGYMLSLPTCIYFIFITCENPKRVLLFVRPRLTKFQGEQSHSLYFGIFYLYPYKLIVCHSLTSDH